MCVMISWDWFYTERLGEPIFLREVTLWLLAETLEVRSELNGLVGRPTAENEKPKYNKDEAMDLQLRRWS